MLVTFRSKSYADITMFGDVAVQLLRMMGQSGTVPGALLADDVAPALAKLKAALAQSPQATEPADKDDEEGDKEAKNVGLARRAYPLIELLNAAVASKSDVLWDH